MHKMECDRILELLPGHLDGSLEDRRAAEVELHLRECLRCAAEEKGLREMLALLRNLPATKAPPELMEGVRRRISAEVRQSPASKGLFASARIRIPLEAAAAVLLFLLVYGIQKQISFTDRQTAPPARVETASPSGGTPEPGAIAGKSSIPPMAASTRRPEAPTAPAAVRPRETAESPAAPRERVEARDPAGRGRGVESTADRASESPRSANVFFPTVSATRVSTGAEPVGPRALEEERVEAPAPFRVFSAPPSRLLRPIPYGREVILEVAAGERPGLEERIVRLVERFGGSIRREWHFHGSPSEPFGAAPVPEGAMRVQLPADSAEAFLSELKTLGTIPPEGMPAGIDLPAGPGPDVVAYTLRIRVR